MSFYVYLDCLVLLDFIGAASVSLDYRRSFIHLVNPDIEVSSKCVKGKMRINNGSVAALLLCSAVCAQVRFVFFTHKVRVI